MGRKFSLNTCLLLPEVFLPFLPTLVGTAWVPPLPANCSRFSDLGLFSRYIQVVVLQRGKHVTCWATFLPSPCLWHYSTDRLASLTDKKRCPGAGKGNYRLCETALLLQELYHTVSQLQKGGVERR